MERFEHRYPIVLIIAQHGPNDGKPFFGFVNLKTTWAEWEAKLHHQVARFVAIDQGCAPASIVCCDLEDLPDFIKYGLVNNLTAEKVEPFSFDVEPRHYDQARRLDDTTRPNNGAKEPAVTHFTTRTQTFSDDTSSVVTAPRLPDALRRAADLIDGLTNPDSAEVFLAVQYVTDEQGKQVPLYGVRIEHEPSE